MYDQVKNLSSILKLSGQTCNASLALSDLHSISGSGLIQNISNNYGLYDETIECNTSESDGTFSLTYNAKLKTNEESSNFVSNDTIHTFTKSVTTSNDGNKINTTISVNGTIQGLCEGGLIKSSGNFNLPKTGSLIIGPSYNNKFDNAVNLLPNIINGDDLSSAFKNALNINYTSLALSPGSVSGCGDPVDTVKPTSFNLTKNYMEGNITYGAEYSTDRACSIGDTKTISRTTIDVQLPTPIVIEFGIPGGNYLLQDINTVSTRTVTITVEGRSDTSKNCCISQELNESPSGLNILLSNIVTGGAEDFLPSGVTVPQQEEGSILTQNDLNYSPIDGSYSLTLAYICASGCEVI